MAKRRLNDELRETKIIRYNVGVFSGRESLSESEKQRWRQAVLELERTKLLKVYGSAKRATAVELTPKGAQV